MNNDTTTVGTDPAALPVLEAPAPGEAPGDRTFSPALGTIEGELILAEKRVREGLARTSELDRLQQEAERTLALDLATRDDMRRAYAILKEAVGK